jgi:uncharacterized protein YegP (UPF0339 family)
MFGAFFVLNAFKFIMGTFVISKRLNDFYKFEFVSRKGKTIFTSTSYELKFECEEEIELLKSAAENFKYLKFKTSRGKYFFKIILDDKIFAGSRKYSTELMMQKGIDEIIKYISKSEILDFANGDAIFDDV